MRKTTRPTRAYPETLELIESAELPRYCDTSASKLDYVVRLGMTVIQSGITLSPSVNFPDGDFCSPKGQA